MAQSDRKTPNIAESAAATPTLKQDQPIRIPALSTPQVTRLEAQAGPAPKVFVLPKRSQPASPSAVAGGVCYTLREQRFRAPADGSSMPLPNGSATCTEISELHLRNAQVVSVNAQAVPAK